VETDDGSAHFYTTGPSRSPASQVGKRGEAFEQINIAGLEVIDDPRRVEMPGDQIQGAIEVGDNCGPPRRVERAGRHGEAELDACHTVSCISGVAIGRLAHQAPRRAPPENAKLAPLSHAEGRQSALRIFGRADAFLRCFGRCTPRL
jgi:hypothetical protein